LSRRYELRVLEYLRNYREVAEKVRDVIRSIDPEAKVYVFGSVVEGRYTALSDIDILVITNNINKKYEIMAKVYSSIEAPIELHITTEELFKRWYRRFIDEDLLVEV